jgi:hypothetical protein
MDVLFEVAGQPTPAAVTGFGTVFSVSSLSGHEKNGRRCCRPFFICATGYAIGPAFAFCTANSSKPCSAEYRTRSAFVAKPIFSMSRTR